VSRYVYKQLSAVDIAVLFVFIFTPVFYVAGDFILRGLGTVFVIAYTGFWLLLIMVWLGVAAWWVGRRLRRLFTRT
jgi:hypothetical protein